MYTEEIDESATLAEVKIMESLEEVKALAEANGFVQTTILFHLINSQNTVNIQMMYNNEPIGDLIPIIEGQTYYKINLIAVVIDNVLHIDTEVNTSTRLTVNYQ